MLINIKYKGFLFTFLFFILLFKINAQEYGFKLYTTKDGLVSNQVYAFKQNSDGFLWIGTPEGVNCFDGLKFKTFTKNNGLTNSFIRDIDFSGDTVFLIERNVIDIIINNKIKKYYESKNSIFSSIVHIDNKPYIIIENITNKQFQLLDLIKKSFNEEYSQQFDFKSGFDYYYYTKTNTYKYNNHQLFKLSKNNTRYEIVVKNLPDFDSIVNMYLTNNGLCYVILKSKNDFKTAINIIAIDKSGNIRKRFNLLENSKTHQINNLFPISDELLVVSGEINKVYFINSGKIYITNYNFYGGGNFLKDNENNLWEKTDRGLFKFFYKGILNFPSSNGYPLNVWGIFPGNDEKIWFDSFSQGMFCYKSGQLFKKLEKSGNIKLAPHFGAAKGFTDDIIIPCGLGVMIYNLKNESFRFVKFKNRYTSLFAWKDNIGERVLCGANGNLFALNKDYSMDSVCSVLNFGSSANVLSVTRRNNSYYLGCSGDILEFNIETKKGRWLNMKNIRVNSITTDYKNNIWAATDEGIYYFSQKDTLRFLRNENLMALIIDKKNRLFAVNRSGLFKLDLNLFYNKKNSEFELFGENEGFKDAGDQNAFYMDDEGNLWLPGSENSVKIIPDELELNVKLLKPIIENALATDNENKPVFILQNQILKYSQKNVNFYFLAVYLTSPEKVKYQFRLIGYNNTWSEPSKKREANFTNLSPGNYSFEVRASMNNKFDNLNVVKINFSIKPPFWQRWWFNITLLFSVFLIIWLIFRWQLGRQKKKALVKQKMVKLEMDLLHSQIEPHFIGNSLEIIKNFINNKNTDNALDAINNFGFMLRFIAETARQSYISLDKEIQMLKNFINFQKLRYGEKINFVIDIDENIVLSKISIPPLIIQPFVENAIVHGLQHKIGTGIIKIRIVKKNENFINIRIFDNGIGRANSQKLKNNSILHQSLGIENSKERLKIFNKSSLNDIEYNDREDGTEIVINLKYI